MQGIRKSICPKRQANCHEFENEALQPTFDDEFYGQYQAGRVIDEYQIPEWDLFTVGGDFLTADATNTENDLFTDWYARKCLIFDIS